MLDMTNNLVHVNSYGLCWLQTKPFKKMTGRRRVRLPCYDPDLLVNSLNFCTNAAKWNSRFP